MTTYVLIVLGFPEVCHKLDVSLTIVVRISILTYKMMLPYTRTPCGSVRFHVDFPTLLGERGDSWHSFHVM